MMKMKMKSSFVLLTLVVSSSAYAGNRVHEVMAENPSASPYTILEKLFIESSEPAQLLDFDLNTDTKSNQRCAFARPDMTEPAEVDGFRIEDTMVVVPGHPAIPAKGPLFPAKPATPDQVRKVVGVLIGITDRDSLFNKTFLNYIKAEEKNDELLITIKKDDGQTGGFSFPYSPVVYHLKKNQNLITFKMTSKTGYADEATLYGYCYRQ